MVCISTCGRHGSLRINLQAFLLHFLIAMSLQYSFFPTSITPYYMQAQAQVLSNEEFEALLQDLKKNQFFTGASILGFLNPPFLTTRITILVPTDVAIANAVNRFSALALAYPTIIQFHILGRNLGFKQLQLLPEGTWLPTMVPGKGVQVTSADPSNFTLNHARITNPDLCPSVSAATIACQGIDRLLDMSSILVPEPQNPPFPPAPAAPPSPPPASPSPSTASPHC